MEIKPLECLKMTFVAGEIELEREKQFLNDMVSVFRERERVSGWEVGRRRPVHTSSGLHFSLHFVHGKSPCLFKKKKKKLEEELNLKHL